MANRVYVVDTKMRVLFPGNGDYTWDPQAAPALGAKGACGMPVAAHFPVGPYRLVWASRFGYCPTWHVFPAAETGGH